jgi:cell division protein FtsQ
MRRLNDITIQVEDRQGGARPQANHAYAAPKPSAAKLRRRPPMFWTKRARRVGLAVLLLGGVVALPVWAVRSGAGARISESVRLQVVDLSGRAGFKVEEIYVEGRHRTPREDLIAALQVERGDPIFGIDLTATRQRLEEISWVKSATLERRLPGDVHIIITERDPVAVWQNEGHYYLVDKEGLVVGDQVADFPDLPLIVGEGAPDHAAALLEMLKSEPEMQKRVKAAQWISGRRWNLTMDATSNGIDVRLPEEDPTTAWHDLAKLEGEQKILERKVALIDMRLTDRLVLRATGGAEESHPLQANSTTKHKIQPGKDA